MGLNYTYFCSDCLSLCPPFYLHRTADPILVPFIAFTPSTNFWLAGISLLHAAVSTQRHPPICGRLQYVTKPPQTFCLCKTKISLTISFLATLLYYLILRFLLRIMFFITKLWVISNIFVCIPGKPFEDTMILNAALANIMESILLGHHFDYDDPNRLRLLTIINENIRIMGSPMVLVRLFLLKHFTMILLDNLGLRSIKQVAPGVFLLAQFSFKTPRSPQNTRMIKDNYQPNSFLDY